MTIYSVTVSFNAGLVDLILAGLGEAQNAEKSSYPASKAPPRVTTPATAIKSRWKGYKCPTAINS